MDHQTIFNRLDRLEDNLRGDVKDLRQNLDAVSNDLREVKTQTQITNGRVSILEETQEETTERLRRVRRRVDQAEHADDLEDAADDAAARENEKWRGRIKRSAKFFAQYIAPPSGGVAALIVALWG